jgi:hypothetical protein
VRLFGHGQYNLAVTVNGLQCCLAIVKGYRSERDKVKPYNASSFEEKAPSLSNSREPCIRRIHLSTQLDAEISDSPRAQRYNDHFERHKLRFIGKFGEVENILSLELKQT